AQAWSDAAPAAAAPTPATAAGGSASVQIGAFSSTEIADREYAAVAGRFGQYASGAEKRVTEVTSSSGSTLYRTTFTGLSRERALAFCNALKAAGRDCIVR
ncbi:SPOR domain-containing protein, partial [Pseudomonas sp. ODNR1LW]|nr:SPOR domain-containing protein [Pseudomonas sp. ODNR1LW]